MDKIPEIVTIKLVNNWEYLSPILFPKKPETIEPISGKNIIAYSIFVGALVGMPGTLGYGVIMAKIAEILMEKVHLASNG